MDSQKAFVEHLGELRSRLFYVLLTFLGGAGLGYALRESLLSLLFHPLNQKVYYSNPAGSFSFVLQLVCLFGLVVAVPAMTYQTLRFLQPALPPSLMARIGQVALASCLLSLLGHQVSLPAALRFLAGVSTGPVESLINATEYFSFVAHYLVGFALVFQLPLLLITLNRVIYLRPRTLMRQQGVMLLISFVLAAILTPTPDPLNQAVMALPIALLYQLAIAWIYVANRNRIEIIPARASPSADPLLKEPRERSKALTNITKPSLSHPSNLSR